MVQSFQAKALKRPPQRILVMRYRFIGDTLLAVPFLRDLRRAYPAAQIDVMVGPDSGELLTHCPYINRLLCFDPKRKLPYHPPYTSTHLTSFWQGVEAIRAGQYDTVFILKRSFSSAAMAFLAGVPQTIGFDTEWRGWMLSHKVPYNPKQHEAECFLDLLRVAGIPTSLPLLEAWWSDDDELLMARAFKPFLGQPNVLLHVTSTNRAKVWKPERFAALLMMTAEMLPNMNIHCLGGSTDKPHIQAVFQILHQNGFDANRLHDWSGKTTLLQSLAFIQKMDAVIGVDSGTIHMAAAVGTPVVGLYGPMDPVLWGPLTSKLKPETMHQTVQLGLDCQPCNLKVKCPREFQCMVDLSVEQVLPQVLQQVGQMEKAKSSV